MGRLFYWLSCRHSFSGNGLMTDLTMLAPVFALIFWTFFVLLQIPIARFRAAFKREVKASDFKLGESASVPAHVCLPNRNYMNLLELPVLFYVLCLVVVVTGISSPAYAIVAWAYVMLRVLHSIIHLGYNNVVHRLSVFAISNLVLLAFGCIVAWRLFI